jgi:iron complex transport system ATP-binding protein
MGLTMAVIEIENLCFGYHGRPIGRDLSLSLDAGDVTCLLGPNGSGKTTFLKTILGLQPALGGTIRIAGENAADWSAARRAQNLAYVPQSISAAFPFPVREMVLMGRTARLGLFAYPGENDRAEADAALEKLGVAALAERSFTEISGGERQLVVIARALAQQAKAVILDEPTASLDFANQGRVLEIISWLKRQGLTVLFSTHHPDQAFAVADKVAMMRQGSLVGAGSVASVLTETALRDLYGVHVSISDVGGRKVCFAELPNKQWT